MNADKLEAIPPLVNIAVSNGAANTAAMKSITKIKARKAKSSSEAWGKKNLCTIFHVYVAFLPSSGKMSHAALLLWAAVWWDGRVEAASILVTALVAEP